MDFYDYLQKNAKDDKIDNVVVGAIITNSKDEIFLAKRRVEDFMGGLYEIPSGKTKNNEKLYEALLREVKEETNLNVIKVNSYIDQFDYLSSSCKKCRQFNFNVEVDDKQILLTEHDSYKWAKLEDIANEDEISPEVKKVLLTYIYNQNQMKI